ncbi:hypothetical protein IB244_29570 [Rhizobium sp. RHZ02]|uniref:hypothetical protein n=1 Tax=Rhizobium sp. RHZ02 TaxID=2769306 RepID=UPI00177AC42A|nr:hypothetical protein [Rhizobium sp. RHZ02]MBD9455627.1 hypothetical protein [Rhizobium sp. RHZ02]
MIEEPTTLLAFRLTDGEWQAMFLHPDGSGSVKHDVPVAELIEMILDVMARSGENPARH